MNFEWKDVGEQHLREDVCLYNMQTRKVFSDRMMMTFLKIPMLRKDADDCKTTLERWLYILKNMETMEAIPQTFLQEPVFRNLGKVARYAALNESDKIAYKASLKAYRDAYAIAETERQLGREEGREEEIKKAIRFMASYNIPLESIADQYNMTVDEVNKIINSDHL